MMQRLFDEMWAELRTASTERRALVVITLACAALLAALARVDHPVLLAAVAGCAAVAALQPASHAGLIVIAIVLARWLATADDPTSPDAALLAITLVAFHLSIALMATLPHPVTLHPTLRRRWAMRFATLSASATATWALVELFSRRTLGPSTALATAAVLVVAGGLWVVRASLSRPTR